MSIPKRLARLQVQVDYVVSCLNRVIADAKAANADWSMYANWRDYLTGKTVVPREGQTWADAAKEQSASLDPVALEAAEQVVFNELTAALGRDAYYVTPQARTESAQKIVSAVIQAYLGALTGQPDQD